MSSTSTKGRPAPKRLQLAPPLVVRYTPRNVAAYTVFLSSGLTTSRAMGTSGNPVLALTKVRPPSVDLATREPEMGLSDPMYSVVLSAHSAVELNPCQPGTVPISPACVQVAPPLC